MIHVLLISLYCISYGYDWGLLFYFITHNVCNATLHYVFSGLDPNSIAHMQECLDHVQDNLLTDRFVLL